MDNKVLNETYRPDRFDQVVGQDKVIETLKGSMRENRVQNAYIFRGVTGTGKTTLARVFSKALICRNRGEDQEPCGECEACITFKKNPSLVDVIEIDAGENRGIDKIRELKDSFKYTPKEAYKIYIIDEVHMLTKEAFTALLKPIEEPPKGVIFLLLTTEYDKIMKTIKNRCVKLTFNKLPVKLIVDRLRTISNEKNILISDSALNKIAIASEGVMREAITTLEQISLIVIDREIVDEDLIGLIDMEETYIKELLYLILNKNTVDIMACIDNNESFLSEADFNYVISRLRRYLYEEDLDGDSLKLVSDMINIFMEYKNKLMYNISIKTLLELACIDSVRICSEQNNGLETLISKFLIQNKEIEEICKREYKPVNDLDMLKVEDTEISKKDTNLICDNTVIYKDKIELFKDLMLVKYKELEDKFNEFDFILDEESVLTFLVNSIEDKKEITGYLRRMYSQDLKPVCEINGFKVKVG